MLSHSAQELKISKIFAKNLKTTRLRIVNWEAFLDDPMKREPIKHALKEMLTDKIMRYLPLSMQFPADHGSIGKWMSDLSNEADVLCMHEQESSELTGLIMLFADPDVPENIHIGYFFGETYWGKGYATEAVKAVVNSLRQNPQIRLFAGAQAANTASINVLAKAGFSKITEESTATRWFFELSP